MPVNGISVGRDVTLTIIDPVQGTLRFSNITGFESKPTVVKKKSVGLDGISRPVVFHEGWAGSLDIDRENSNVDDYWATVEQNYYSGISIPAATITETITEVSGAISQFRYDGVVLTLEDPGGKKGDDIIKQKMSFEAQRRIKVS